MKRAFAIGPVVLACVVAAAALPACLQAYNARPLKGGGFKVKADPSRPFDAADVLVPPGYQVEAVAAGLTYPTGITFDEKGTLYVVESGYAYGEDVTKPRLLEVRPEDGTTRVVAEGEKNGPWDGVDYHDGAFYVAEGGEMEGGRILRITRDGKITALVEGLPSFGDHHTNGPVVKDGFVYFGQGTATNSGVVGEDNLKFGWLKRHPDFHDIPCRDIRLSGENFKTKNVLDEKGDDVMTGPYQPFGTPASKDQIVKGHVPCTGAVMRVPVAGGQPEVVAWGLRNPFGLAFGTDGKLYVTENGFDVRGSRKVWGGPDNLYRIDPQKPGVWYGWPDYTGGQAVMGTRFKTPGQSDPPKQVLAGVPNDPPAAVARFGVHSSSHGIDVSRNAQFGYVDQAFVAQFGDLTPNTGKVLNPVGFRVVRVDLTNGVITDFVANKGDKTAPASYLKNGGMERPVAVKFDRAGTSLYVVDFGIMTTDRGEGPKPLKKTGMIWRVSRTEGGAR